MAFTVSAKITDTMAQMLRIVFSNKTAGRRQRPAPLYRLSGQAALSPQLLQLLDLYSRKARLELLQPSASVVERLLKAVHG